MAWFFEGNGQQIIFGVSKNGFLSAHGRCSVRYTIGGVSQGRGPGTWDMGTGTVRAGSAAQAFFKQNGEKAIGVVSYFPALDDEPAFVHLDIVAPNDFTEHAFALLKLTMGNPSIRFRFTVDFSRFTDEDAPPSEIPKYSEFYHADSSRPIFCKNIDICFLTFDPTRPMLA
jgi:hypothetical protein